MLECQKNVGTVEKNEEERKEKKKNNLECQLSPYLDAYFVIEMQSIHLIYEFYFLNSASSEIRLFIKQD